MAKDESSWREAGNSAEHGFSPLIAEAHTFLIEKTQSPRTTRVRGGTQGTSRPIAFREIRAVREEVRIKKLMLISFALALVMCLLALAQDTTKAAQAKQETAKAEEVSTKAVTVTGKVSADAKTFKDKANKSWTVTNPEALKGEEEHEATLKAHVDAAKNEIHVFSSRWQKKK